MVHNRMKSLSRPAMISFGLILSSKILGFMREIILAYKYGTSYINDAYSICISLPTVLFAIFASGIAQSYIPIVSRIDDEEERTTFFSNVMTALFLASLVLCCVCLAFDKNIVQLLAPGFDSKTTELTKKFIDIVIWYLPLHVIFNILSANSQVHESFIAPNFCDSVIINVVVIAFILLSTKETAQLIVVGQNVSIIIAVVLLYLFCRRELGTRYRPTISFRDSHLSMLFKLAIPLGISVMANQINSVTDRVFSSYMGEGVTSALGYANRVQILFLTLTTTVFMSMCFPRMNALFSDGKKQEGLYYVEKGLLLTSLLSIPFMMIIMAYSSPIIRALFQRGVFNDQSTQITSECLAFYAIGIPFYAFAEIGNKTLAANLKQKYIMKNTLIMVASNIILDFIFVNLVQHKGLALATSIAGIISVVVVYHDLYRFELLPDDCGLIKQTSFIITLSVISIIVSVFLYHCLLTHLGLPIIASFYLALAAFGITYIVLCIVFKVQIFYWLLTKIRVFGRKR